MSKFDYLCNMYYLFVNCVSTCKYIQDQSIFWIPDDEDENYTVPHNARPVVPQIAKPQPILPPPPGKGRIVIGPNSAEPARRKLPAQPQRMPVQSPRTHAAPPQRALPATAHIYGNVSSPTTGLYHNISVDSRGSSPASAMLTNLANKRILSNVKR